MPGADRRAALAAVVLGAGTIYTVAVDPSGARGGKPILGLLLTVFFGVVWWLSRRRHLAR